MKKLTLIIAVAMFMSFTGCGSSSESSKTAENETEQTTIVETTESETETETEAETSAESDESSVLTAELKEFTPVEGLSKNYADLEKRCFAYNGKIYTLGENTLQDLVDDGIPFEKNELNNIGNNVNKNYETARYTARINDFVTMQFTFINTTDTNITEAECLLCNVRLYTLYVPQSDYEDSMNESIINNLNDASDHVCFSFPLTLTKDQLLENNGDATEITDTNYVKYLVDSEVYMGSSGYTFEFDKTTNQFKEVNISWLP